MLGRHGASQTLNTMLDVFTSLKDWISSMFYTQPAHDLGKYTLKNKASKNGFCSNAIEETFWVPQITFQRNHFSMKKILLIKK